MTTSLQYAIGLMSGTSADAMDGVLIAFEGDFSSLRVLEFVSEKFTVVEKKLIFKNSQDKTCAISEICDLNVALSHKAARVVKKILKKTAVAANDVVSIGYHGQTVQHRPQKKSGATLQLGDGPTLSYLTGIPVVNNFRTKDMAAGGQGAPLVPFAHRILFGTRGKNVAVHNLGGISNLTYLGQQKTLAFDTGPANMLMDALMQKLLGKAFDKNGSVARQGQANEDLLKIFLKHPFFKKRPPKSTGRELFGEAYVASFLKEARKRKLKKVDIIATAARFTALSIVQAYKDFIVPYGLDEIIFCGGGSFNSHLLQIIADELNVRISTSKDYGYDPQTIEAVSFAVLGVLAIQRRPNQIAILTGGRADLSLGQISYPD